MPLSLFLAMKASHQKETQQPQHLDDADVDEAIERNRLLSLCNLKEHELTDTVEQPYLPQKKLCLCSL